MSRLHFKFNEKIRQKKYQKIFSNEKKSRMNDSSMVESWANEYDAEGLFDYGPFK